MNRVRRGEIGWQNLDSLHRTSLEEVLGEFGVRGLREAQKEQLTRLWHRLHGWPDATPGLTRLKARFIIAPCSNGNVALIVNMAKHAGLPWDCVLGAELAHAYKPDRIVYETAAGLLGLPCEQVLMVAAHGGDLRAAAAAGLRTAYIPRPLEHGPEHAATFVPERGFDIAANDLTDLAARLGA
jgi:2-haloacid dehalogenase